MVAVEVEASGRASAEAGAVAGAPLHRDAELPEGFWYGVKRRVLGPPLVTEQLQEQRLSRPLALGVLSCDGLSSAAYGTEEILYALLPFFGIAAFTLVLPMTLLVLFGVVLVVLSYREVVSVYTRAGGSYVVARENFGPRIAQVAPEGRHARQILAMQGSTVAVPIAGISWLAPMSPTPPPTPRGSRP
jgi:amino acid transporter